MKVKYVHAMQEKNKFDIEGERLRNAEILDLRQANEALVQQLRDPSIQNEVPSFSFFLSFFLFYCFWKEKNIFVFISFSLPF